MNINTKKKKIPQSKLLGMISKKLPKIKFRVISKNAEFFLSNYSHETKPQS